MEFTPEFIRELWTTGKSLKIGNKDYRVGKMSYGDYFLEPTTWKGGEMDGFSPNTYLLEKYLKVNRQVVYRF